MFNEGGRLNPERCTMRHGAHSCAVCGECAAPQQKESDDDVTAETLRFLIGDYAAPEQPADPAIEAVVKIGMREHLPEQVVRARIAQLRAIAARMYALEEGAHFDKPVPLYETIMEQYRQHYDHEQSNPDAMRNALRGMMDTLSQNASVPYLVDALNHNVLHYPVLAKLLFAKKKVQGSVGFKIAQREALTDQDPSTRHTREALWRMVFAMKDHGTCAAQRDTFLAEVCSLAAKSQSLDSYVRTTTKRGHRRLGKNSNERKNGFYILKSLLIAQAAYNTHRQHSATQWIAGTDGTMPSIIAVSPTLGISYFHDPTQLATIAAVARLDCASMDPGDVIMDAPAVFKEINAMVQRAQGRRKEFADVAHFVVNAFTAQKVGPPRGVTNSMPHKWRDAAIPVIVDGVPSQNIRISPVGDQTSKAY